MKFSLSILGQKLRKETRNKTPKTIAEYNREILVKQGADQFKKLIDKGLSIPVALL